MLQIIVFIILAVITFLLAGKRYFQIYKNINLGKDDLPVDELPTRIKNTVLIALGQKKMFKRLLPAILHLFVYVAFLLTQVELVEILIDGVTGKHRFFYSFEGFRPFYIFIINSIEILSVLAFVATLIFLTRRNLFKVPRFQMSEMTGWPKLDGNIILYLEVLLLFGVFSMNGADEVLHKVGASHAEGSGGFGFSVSSWLGPILFGGLDESTLHVIERIGWWGHILTVFFFLNYLPFSKHLHILLAFPNTFHGKLQPKGEVDNMPAVQKEVQSMMSDDPYAADGDMDEEIPEFGANDVFGLSKTQILAAYTCTECGRCSSNCPASMTGKKLSPRKIMMDVRDRATEIGESIVTGDDSFKENKELPLTADNYVDGKSLFDYITREEIHACTTCNACVEACPVLINPLDIILELRRYEILSESAGPQDWLPMFNAIENGGAVWQMNVDREQWMKS